MFNYSDRLSPTYQPIYSLANKIYKQYLICSNVHSKPI